MGEARARGTKAERVEQAVEHEKCECKVWVVIETAVSVPVTDSTGAFVVDDDGSMKYGPDEATWQALRAEDAPDWVKQEAVIAEFMDGIEINAHPAEGGRWYRGIVCTPPATDEAVH